VPELIRFLYESVSDRLFALALGINAKGRKNRVNKVKTGNKCFYFLHDILWVRFWKSAIKSWKLKAGICNYQSNIEKICNFISKPAYWFRVWSQKLWSTFDRHFEFSLANLKAAVCLIVREEAPIFQCISSGPNPGRCSFVDEAKVFWFRLWKRLFGIHQLSVQFRKPDQSFCGLFIFPKVHRCTAEWLSRPATFNPNFLHINRTVTAGLLKSVCG